MSSTDNLQRPTHPLLKYLELQSEVGLLPSYVHRPKLNDPLPSNASKMNTGVSMPLTPSSIPPAEKENHLKILREKIGDCKRCRLCSDRTNIVFGVGNPKAELMFVGEGPGRDEDLKGEPFVGRAGQLLTKIIEAMGFTRDDIYIANVVKCRPPENRNPAPDEIETCSPFLLEQIQIIQPKIIVCLGNFAAQTILSSEKTITSLRGKLHAWPTPLTKEKLNIAVAEESIQVMPTYHPAYLLRNPAMKKPVWDDMKIVMEALKK